MDDKKGILAGFYEKAEKRTEVVTVILIFLISFFLKFYLIRLSNGLGADYGAYLKWVDVLRGFDVVGKGLRYPPIYPLLLGFPLLFLDEVNALIVCAAFIFSVIVFPYFLLARKIFGRGIFSIISSLLIVFNTLYSEMIGWGGNANMLALVFLACFLIFWINCIRDIESLRDRFLSAFFISLTVGSHYLAAAYLLLFFLIFLFLLLVLWCKNREDKNILNFAKSTLIIGLMGSALCVPYISSYTHILNSAALRETNLSLADQRTLIYLFCFPWENLFTAILLFLGIIGVLILIREDKLLGMTLAALFISGCLPIFFTLHPARWVFFWPIPLFLGVPIFVKKLLLKLRGFNRFKKLLSLASLIALISASIFISIPYLFSQVSRFKILTPQLLGALDYLRNGTPADSIIATSGPYKRGGEGGGHCYGWWVEGYADRKCVATAYLRFLTYYDEREAAQKANILFSGTDVLLNDFVMVAETFPAGVGNPEISINIGDFYDKLLLLADDQTIITCCQNINITLSSIKGAIANQNYGNRFSVNVSYTIHGSTALVKSIRILSDSTIEVSFHVLQANITKIFMPLFRSDFVDLNGYLKGNDKEIELEMTTSMGAHVRLNMIVDYNGVFNTYVKLVTGEEREFATLVFDNPPHDAVIRLRFILPKLVGGSNHVQYFNAYRLIEEMGIDYILINVNRRREFEWFNCDNDNFSQVYKNDEVVIFKVSFQH
ncbi:MAG: hypothetical protein QXQ85_03805 [Candidatus Bathyarchaeia archaeon]